VFWLGAVLSLHYMREASSGIYRSGYVQDMIRTYIPAGRGRDKALRQKEKELVAVQDMLKEDRQRGVRGDQG
jgi:hypothetical protein